MWALTHSQARKRSHKAKLRRIAIRKKQMFNINEFMNAAKVDDTKIVKRGTEEFKIRRLNGVERLKFNDLTTMYDRTVFVLGHALLSGVNDAPIGEQNAVRFIERYSSLADALFSDIFEFTQEVIKSESEAWELASKNTKAASEETTTKS